MKNCENGLVFRVVVSAAGNRARSVVKRLLEAAGSKVRIVAIFDPDRTVAEEAAHNIWNSPDAVICSSWEEALQHEAEWAMIFSPNYAHKEQIIAAFQAGKDVFSEKPIATKIEDCQAIYNAWKKYKKVFATGFVLRYALIYRKAYEILRSGQLGKLVSIEANENIRFQHGGYIMSNWRRLTRYAGPHILEKCCHDLDLIEWFADSLPSRVAAFHSHTFFKPENRCLEEKYGKDAFRCFWDPHRLETPFNDDSDLHDSFVSVARFRNGVQVAFNYSMFSSIPERRMRFQCTEGTMTLNIYEQTLRWKNIGDVAETTLKFTDCDGHGGGDAFIMEELFETMSKGIAPKCSGDEGLQSAIYALALDRAATENKIIDLEEIWNSLGR